MLEFVGPLQVQGIRQFSGSKAALKTKIGKVKKYIFHSDIVTATRKSSVLPAWGGEASWANNFK